MDNDIRHNLEDFKKELFVLTSEFEGLFGMRILLGFQCIKCGQVNNDIVYAVEHMEICSGIEKVEDKPKESLSNFKEFHGEIKLAEKIKKELNKDECNT